MVKKAVRFGMKAAMIASGAALVILVVGFSVVLG